MPTTNCGFSNEPSASGRNSTLLVQIGGDHAYHLSRAQKPDLPLEKHPALVDTGASESCIDSDLALGLRLPIMDRQNVAGVHGIGIVNIHLAQIYIPALKFTIYGSFAGVHLRAGGQPHSALIGRDFLQHFTMKYEGRTGTVILSND